MHICLFRLYILLSDFAFFGSEMGSIFLKESNEYVAILLYNIRIEYIVLIFRPVRG